MSGSRRLTLRALLLAALASCALAGFDTKCTYSAEWTNNDKKIEGTASPLSGCQAETLGFGTQTNNFLLGGNGNAEVIGIPAGGGSDGCGNNDECMKWCQALCCMAPGCKYAQVQKDTKTEYVGGVYKEEVKYFYCMMFGSGSLKDSDTKSTCTKLGSTYCDDLALSAYGMNATMYQQVVGLGAYATCPSRRKLQASSVPKMQIVPTKREMLGKIRATFKCFDKLKREIVREQRNNTLKKTIRRSGVCKMAYPFGFKG